MITATDVELAYMAGVVDSDGTIGIKRNTYSMRVTGDSFQASYSERVCVRQVTSQAVDLLHKHFKGSRRIERSSLKRGKPLFSWQVTDRRAAICLFKLLPHLRIKRIQAENCLALRQLKNRSKKQRMARGRGHAGAACRSSELTREMESLKVRASELNRMGIV